MAKRPGKGRPPKLTPEAHKAVVEAIAAGVPQKYAALRAGVGASTLRAWLAKGRRQTAGDYQALSAAIKKATADHVTKNVAIIQKAAQGGAVVQRTTTTTTRPDGTTTTKVVEKMAAPIWTASAWKLERLDPKEFGRPSPRPQEAGTGAHAPLVIVAGAADVEPPAEDPGADHAAPA